MSPLFRLPTFRLLILLGMLAAPLERASAAYVQSEHVELRLDHGEYRTSRSLDPRHQYQIEITSPYTLRPLLNHKGHCRTHKVVVLFSTTTYEVCRLPLLVNGALVPTLERYSREVYNNTHAAYFIDPDTSRHYVPTLQLIVWGTGRPLTLQSTADFTDAIPTARAEVVDVDFRQEQAELEYKRQRQEEARAEQARQAAEQARKDQERRELYAMLRKLIVPGAVVVIVLLIGIALARKNAPARERARVARLGQQIEQELKVLNKIKKGIGNA